MFKRKRARPGAASPERGTAPGDPKHDKKDEQEEEQLPRREFHFIRWGGPSPKFVFVVVVVVGFVALFGLILYHLVPFWKAMVDRTIE